MEKERKFSHKGEQVSADVRWRFVELPVTFRGNDVKQSFGVEYLSVDFTFGNAPERCWYWYDECQADVNQALYSGKTVDEMVDWLADLDMNYSTTKSERKEALEVLIKLNSFIMTVADEMNINAFWRSFS